MSTDTHAIHFYENDPFLVHRVAGFVEEGLCQGETVVVIATASHREAIESHLWHSGVADLFPGRYCGLDAGETLDTFLADGWPHEASFLSTMGRVLLREARGAHRIRVFGEMVTLLWENGGPTAAVRLERLWNRLAEMQSFSLLCAYPMEILAEAKHTQPFFDICCAHSHICVGASASQSLRL